MKKFLVVLLACALIFGFASTAMAADTQITEFSDIADQSQAAKTAIMKLAVLGVLEGNEGVGGPIRPADNLTRAEFAKIVCYLTGNVKSAEALANVASRFPDVQVGSWYTGWVNMAVQAGYFVGDPAGNFRPNANITMNEVITVALRAMGYNDKLPGSWPGNYSMKAANIGVLDDVTFVGSAAATRADAFIICNAVLGKNMVAHIDNELAFAMALTTKGELVDKDGFAELYYMTNEDDKTTDEGRSPETILHKAFKCIEPRFYFNVAANNAYDETAAWEFVDFKDGELNFLFAHDEYEVAETYYINKGFTMFDLAGMQSDVVINDDDEVVFVGVRGSYVFADKIYEDDNERVVADGKTYRTRFAAVTWDEDGAADGWLVANNDIDLSGGVFAASTKDAGYYPGKVYLDKDGYAVAVKSYELFDGEGFGIFEELDEDIVSYHDDTLVKDAKFDATKDYALIREGKFAKAEDLEEFDTVYYLGEGVSVKAFLALPAAEGEFTNHNSTSAKLTVAGTAYKVVDNFRYSDDGGESWDIYSEIGTIDKSSFGEAVYGKGYDFGKLAFVAANAVNTKVIGVVTEADPSWAYYDTNGDDPDGMDYAARYEQITIFNAEGKEVTYKFHKDFRTDYNALFTAGSYSGNVGNDRSFDLTTVASDEFDTAGGINAGDIVQLVLDKNDAVKKLVNYASYDNTDPADVEVSVAAARERITITGTVIDDYDGSYTLPESAVVFKSTDDSGFDEVDLSSVASVLAGNFDAYKVIPFDMKGSNVSVLYIQGGESTELYGVVTGKHHDSNGWYYMVSGEKIYGENADIDNNLPVAISYQLSGGEIDNIATPLAIIGFVYESDVDDITADPDHDYYGVYGYVDKYTSGKNANLVVADDASGIKKNVYVSDAYLYDLVEEDDEIEARDMVGSYVLAICDKGGDAVFVVVVAQALDELETAANALREVISGEGVEIDVTDDTITISGAAATITDSVTIPAGVNVVIETMPTLEAGVALTFKAGSTLDLAAAALGGWDGYEGLLGDVIQLSSGGTLKIEANGATGMKFTLNGNATLIDDLLLAMDDKLVINGTLTIPLGKTLSSNNNVDEDGANITGKQNITGEGDWPGKPVTP